MADSLNKWWSEEINARNKLFVEKIKPIFSCKDAAQQVLMSVCPSVCVSVCPSVVNWSEWIQNVPEFMQNVPECMQILELACSYIPLLAVP